MTLEDCLPPDLRGPTTTVTRIAAGLSGAGVYRVEAAGKAFVLKVAGESENPSDWRRGFHIQRLAADAGLAPRIVHVDEARRAVLTAFVADRSFLASYANPSTHEAALAQLGRTVRRLHELPLPADLHPLHPREFLAQTWSALQPGFTLPDFARDAIQRVLEEEPPADGRALVLSHNDINPTNLVYDGENILLLDWTTAGPNHPFYDLAVISVFLRMDEGTCRRLLAAHDGEPVNTLPARFAYFRRLVPVLCGSTLLNLARQMKHAGASGTETLASQPSLAEFYQRLQTGAVNLATADGQWAFGLALIKESFAR
ncbi:phosphotransferase [Archangium lansingense]|uniref:phosphotransferase n=1 Tax=Archangium lansingense TaxID=2995310 RepID=UPI003B7FED19